MKRNSKPNYETAAAKAKEFLKYFETKTRAGSGEKIYTLCHHADEDLDNLVREAHGNLLPDDFIYETIHEVLCAFADCQSEEDWDEVRLEPDMYYHGLLKWLSSNLKRIHYCDEAIAEFGLENSDFMDVIAYGQQIEKDEITDLVREALMSLC